MTLFVETSKKEMVLTDIVGYEVDLDKVSLFRKGTDVPYSIIIRNQEQLDKFVSTIRFDLLNNDGQGSFEFILK